MKLNRIFLFVMAACSFGLLSCNSTEQAKSTYNNISNSEIQPAAVSSDNIPKPRIVFENKILEFGKIGPETKPTGEFKFMNEGNAVLEIKNVSQCCGVVISYEKSKYEPGEKGVIKASYTASTYVGKIARIPIVSSNDPVEPEVSLLLTAEIVNKVTTQPESLKLFLDEDNANCPKLKISSTDKQSFAIRDVKSTGNCITAQFDPDLKATEIILDLKADIAKLKQNTKGYVDIIVTHPEMSLVTIPFDVVSRFTVNPPLIIALNTDPGVPVIRKVWIFNKYDQEFEVESISSKNNYITVLNEGKIDGGYQFEIQIMPPPTEGKTSFNDELYVQINNGEKLKIDCNGYYNPPKTE